MIVVSVGPQSLISRRRNTSGLLVAGSAKKSPGLGRRQVRCVVLAANVAPILRKRYHRACSVIRGQLESIFGLLLVERLGLFGFGNS